MRTALLMVSLVLAALLAPPVLGADVFQGTWTATDNDGSSLTLYISGSGTRGAHAVFYVDDAASVCGGGPANAIGSGFVNDGTLDTLLAPVCLPGGNAARGRVFLSFTYDSGTDTLTDNTGVIWSRA